MATDPLISPKLKIARAKHHIVDVTAQIITFLNTNGSLIETFIEPEQGGNRQVVKARLLKSPPPEIAGAVGDTFSNLRSSLDHLVRCLAIKNGEDPCRVEFPFAKSWELFIASKTQKKIAPLSPEAQHLIRSLQPYKTSEAHPEKGGHDMLCALNELRNSDLHRLISPLAMVVAGHQVDVETRPPIGFNVIQAPNWVRFGEDLTAEFMRVPGDAADIKARLQVDIDIGFGEVAPVAGYPVLRVLHDFSNLVSGIVTKFEKRFFG